MARTQNARSGAPAMLRASGNALVRAAESIGDPRNGGALAQAVGMLVDVLRSPVSAIQSHLDSLANLPPEFARVDFLRFRGVIPSGASPTIVQPADDKTPSDMDADVFGVQGAVQDPDTEEEDTALVLASLKETGRGINLFTADFAMNMLVGRNGSLGIMEFPRGVYVVQAGKTVRCRYSISTVTNITAYNTTAGKLYDLILWMNLRRPEG